tara:strand:- start:1516 stop:2766 length:1251 start_codon:yes stop_codon:yes gene_type:complete
MNDQGANLAGIGNLVGAAAEKKKALQMQRNSETEIVEAFNSGDPTQIASVSMRNPKLAEDYAKGLGIGDDIAMQQATDTMRTVLVDPENAEAIYETRIAELTAEGRDPSNTVAALEDYREDKEGHLQEVAMTFAGMAPEEYSAFNEMQAEAPTELVQRIRPDGTMQTLNRTKSGGYTDQAGEIVELTADDRVLESATLTGSPEDFNMSQSDFRELKNQEIATSNLISNAQEAMALLQDTPNVNTLTAAGASAVNSLRAEFDALASIWKPDLESDEVLNPENPVYSDEFKRMGITNNRMKGLLVSMAYARASAREPGGRLTDRDIKLSMDEFGVTADSEAFTTTLKDVATRVVKEFENSYERKVGSKYDGIDLGLDALLGAEAPLQQPRDLPVEVDPNQAVYDAADLILYGPVEDRN